MARFRALAPVETFLEQKLPEIEVAVADREMAGALLVEGEWLEDLHVDPGWQGRGLGGALLAHARLRGAGRLEVRTFNLQAIAFDEARGWRREGAREPTELGYRVLSYDYIWSPPR